MAIAFYYVCCILFYGFVTILLMGSFYIYLENHLSAVMVGVLYVVGSLFCLFKPKSIKLVFAVSPSKHAVLIEELEQNLAGNISDWRNLSICWLLFQWTSNVVIQLGMLVQYKEEFEDTKEVIRFWKTKNDRQHYGQRKKNKTEITIINNQN